MEYYGKDTEHHCVHLKRLFASRDEWAYSGSNTGPYIINVFCSNVGGSIWHHQAQKENRDLTHPEVTDAEDPSASLDL